MMFLIPGDRLEQETSNFKYSITGNGYLYDTQSKYYLKNNIVHKVDNSFALLREVSPGEVFLTIQATNGKIDKIVFTEKPDTKHRLDHYLDSIEWVDFLEDYAVYPTRKNVRYLDLKDNIYKWITIENWKEVTSQDIWVEWNHCPEEFKGSEFDHEIEVVKMTKEEYKKREREVLKKYSRIFFTSFDRYKFF